MAQIYIIKNNINEKVYIGKTEHNYLKRFEEHKCDFKKIKEEKRPLYSAMRKYGKENFYVELLMETDTPEEDEIKFIEKYNSYKNGYNATLGGDGRKYINLDMKKIKEEYTNNNIAVCFLAKKYKVHTDTMTHYLKKEGVTIKKTAELRIRHIKQIDTKTLKVLNIFDSIQIAAKKLNLYNGVHIMKSANGFFLKASGYYWEYEEPFEKYKKQITKINYLKLIKYKGGKCQNCNYSTCNESLEFHHIIKKNKSFKLSDKSYYSLEKLKEETDKCVLLCVNCHREVHDNILKIIEKNDTINFEYK